MPTRFIIVETSMRQTLATAGLAAYADVLDCRLGQIVHESGTTQTRRIKIDGPDRQETLFLKTYRYRPPAWCTRDKPTREASNYAVLRDRCRANVPDVIAFGSRRRFGRLCDAFILTRAVPRAVALDQLAESLWPEPRAAVDDPLRRHLLADTSAMVARMHAAGFCHIDLQWRNLLVSDDDTDAPNVYVIDSSRGSLRRWAVRHEHGRLRDLSSLYKDARRRMTPREQLRWLRTYFGVMRFESQHRALIQTIRYDRTIKDHEA